MTKSQIKNKIVIFEGIGQDKERHELFNFSKVDHYRNKKTGRAYIRILCDSRFYYFLAVQSCISEIEIY